ncbi:MAG: hypothetical protein FD167_1435 [bacterium]|nr:MAG: hypothetical protein FD167_1435 [bacterium]
MIENLTPTTIADERKIKVQELLAQGLSQSEIARQLGIDRSGVHYIIKRANQAGLEPQEAVKERPNTPEIQLICEVLKARNWTQQELADELGKHPQTVYKWLAGEKKPGKETIKKLRDILTVFT